MGILKLGCLQGAMSEMQGRGLGCTAPEGTGWGPAVGDGGEWRGWEPGKDSLGVWGLKDGLG